MHDRKDDIEKYLKGELTPSQMNALEKRALNDPFLADALEGVNQLQSNDLTEDLNHLQVELKKRIRKQKNVIWLWPSRIAAGLVILALSSYIIFLVSERRESNDIALNKQNEIAPTPEAKDSDVSASDSIAPKNEIGPEIQTPEEAPAKLNNNRSRSQTLLNEDHEPQKEQPLADIAHEEEAELSTMDSENIVNPAVTEEKITRVEPRDAPLSGRIKMDAAKKREKYSDDAASDKQKSMADAPAITQGFTDAVHRNIVRGRVTFSDDDMGLPGVNVILKGTNEGTVTDAQGNYQIPVSDPHPTLVFSFIGFSSKEVEADSDELNVQLDADVSELSEVVVVGYSTTNDASTFPDTPPVMELAMPAGGRKVFKEYLKENIRYPEQALKNQVEGKVTIQFSVGTSGQLSDFRVIRGIGMGCEKEVIRLIKTGPKWSPTKRNEIPVRDKVKVRIRFSLPKK